MNTRDDDFAISIKKLRKDTGLTQQELADIIGVRKTTISNYESGYATPPMSTLKKLMQSFNLPASYFIQVDNSANARVRWEQFQFGIPVPFYLPDNINGLKTGNKGMMDSNITIPRQINKRNARYISTLAPDSSMSLCGIKRNSCVIINTRLEPQNENIFAAINGEKLIIRKFHNTSEGCFMTAESKKIPAYISTEKIPDKDFIILGTVDHVIVNI